MLTVKEVADLLRCVDETVAGVEERDALRAAVRRVGAGSSAFKVGNGADFSCLTAREQEVFYHLVRGRTNTEIATSLGISVKTFDTHRGRVLDKLGLRNSAELVLWATRRGLVE